MRKPRRILPGACYHVTARTNRREFILESSAMKEMFLQTLRRARKKYVFSITNFCIMGNHVHLLLRPEREENLSRIMQWILSVFAISYNRHIGIGGHVWYDRFGSRVVQNLREYLHASSYISMNPVRAGLVSHRADYPYCGAHHLLEGDHSVLSPPSRLIREMLAGAYLR